VLFLRAGQSMVDVRGFTVKLKANEGGNA